MFVRVVPRVPILVLVIAAAACSAALATDPTFPSEWLWNAPGAMRYAGHMLVEFAVLAALIVAGVAWIVPGHLFDLVRTRPRLWLLVMVFYPIFSVYPQEVIYRAFFAHRYAELLPALGARVAASAAVFAFGHVFFPRAWIAMSLSFAGGLLFAYHYEESHSLLLASIEHALFGQLVFTVGLGRYFYAGERARHRTA
jgi:membrane protease YdiL (CAAX protease family)